MILLYGVMSCIFFPIYVQQGKDMKTAIKVIWYIPELTNVCNPD